MKKNKHNMISLAIWIGALIVMVLLLIWYYRISTIVFTDYRPQVHQTYCALTKTANTPEYPTFLVPGLKGSILTDSNDLVWLRTRDLVTTQDTSPLMAGNTLTPVGVFTRLVSIPFFLEYRGYHRIAADLGCAQNGYTFYYDWRKAPQDIIPELNALVDRVLRETGKKPAIIAHSYGGVIVRGYMQEAHHKLGSIVFVGAPLNPGPVFLVDDLTKGAPVFSNKILTSAPVVVSHESSYYLIPHYGSHYYRGKEVMNAHTWKEDGLGPYSYDPDYSLERLQAVLDRATDYQQIINAPFTGDNSIMVVHNKTLKTLSAILPNGNPAYTGGDGRVGSDAAQPNGIPASQITFIQHPASHSQQLQTHELLERMYQFIAASEE